jgi:hypothetical protein
MAGPIYHYKIRNRTTGLFSTGGYNPPGWNKNGKTWTTLGGLMNHLGYLKQYHRNKGQPDTEVYMVPSEWEIIPIEIRTDEQNGILVADFIRNRKPKANIIIK